MQDKAKVLVTGASGFLGRRIVEMLVERGSFVRALVRKTSRIDQLRLPGVELFCGDVTDAESLSRAFDGIDCVVHAAADNSGTQEGARLVTIEGTRNILDLCVARNIKKLVYISSCSVYGVPDCKEGQVIDENAPLERFPQDRGAYSWAKLEAEKLVTETMAQGKVSAVCLRPGTIYGCGGENYTPMIGFSFRNRVFAVIRGDHFVLPLVYIDNLVTAIIASIHSEISAGQIYNVIDPCRVDKKRYMDTLIRKLYPRARCFYLPYRLLYSTVLVQEALFRAIGRKPLLTRYRLIASQKPILYDSSKIVNQLNWRPTVSFEQAVKGIIESEEQRHLIKG